jgi:hypothetical protein
MDNLNFRFRAYAENENVVVHIKMDGAEAVFRYTDPDAVATLAENMGPILEYAIDDYTLSKNFKNQINNELEEWLKNES